MGEWLRKAPRLSLTLIKAALAPAPDTRASDPFTRCRHEYSRYVLSGLVLAAFLGFAVALAYYSHR